MQNDVVHAHLRLLLQSTQRLRVFVAHVAVQSEPGAETHAVIQRREVEDVAPAGVTAAVIH